MIIKCSGRCGNKIIVPAVHNGKAYLCKSCYKAVQRALLLTISVFGRGKEPHLKLVPDMEADSIS